MQANPIKSVAWIVAALIALIIVTPLVHGWYGDSIVADFLTVATVCGVGLIAVTVVARLRGKSPN